MQCPMQFVFPIHPFVGHIFQFGQQTFLQANGCGGGQHRGILCGGRLLQQSDHEIRSARQAAQPVWTCRQYVIVLSPFSFLLVSIAQWNCSGSDPAKNGEFFVPHSLALIEDLNLLCVADRENERFVFSIE